MALPLISSMAFRFRQVRGLFKNKSGKRSGKDILLEKKHIRYTSNDILFSEYKLQKVNLKIWGRHRDTQKMHRECTVIGSVFIH